MPARLEGQDITCPASVLPANPVVVLLDWPGGIVRRVHIVIPDGHAGLTGIALGFGARPVMPFTQPGYFSGDGEVFSFNYVDNVPGVPWSAFVCNNDLQAHVWEVRFELDEVNVPAVSQVAAMFSPAEIVAAGNAALTRAG